MILKKTISSGNTTIKSIFCGKNKAAWHVAARTDMYFSEREGVVEIDEKGHTDRNQNEENEK